MNDSTNDEGSSGYPLAPAIEAIPLVAESAELTVSPADLFAELAQVHDDGSRSVFLESAAIGPRHGERSLGVPSPPLTLAVRRDRFSLEANNAVGRRLLPAFARALSERGVTTGKLETTADRIRGRGRTDPENPALDETARIKRRTPFDLVRALHQSIARASAPAELTDLPLPAGVTLATADDVAPFPALLGAFAYDAVDFVESLPPPRAPNPTNDPHILLHLADQGFLTRHLEGGTTRFIACALVPTGASAAARRAIVCDAAQQLREHVDTARRARPSTRASRSPQATASSSRITDLDAIEYGRVVEAVQQRIRAGDLFQAVPSRSVRTLLPVGVDAFDIYHSLRALNPSPYMFCLALGAGDHATAGDNNASSANGGGWLIGASPETAIAVHVDTDGRRTVEIRPIAGTKPRGRTPDDDLDERYRVELTTDFKELAEHVMLIDLARNDVARVSRPGTRRLADHFTIERYSHVQHLVSTVHGELRDDLDALHAYVASMNQGTLTGAPKVEAMRQLRRLEPTARGFFGGAVGILAADGALDTCIVIRSLRVRDGVAHARAGAGIVADSDPASEFHETERKLAAPLAAIELAAGSTDNPPAEPPTPDAVPTDRLGVLLIDNVDSFALNLADALATLGADVVTVRNTAPLDAIERLIAERDLRALVISPGPGRPETAGVSPAAVSCFLSRLPILGICLGHQVLVHALGGDIGRAPNLVHGKATRIRHDGQGLFEDAPNPLVVGRYHSLAATRLPADGALIATAHLDDDADRTVMAVRHQEHAAFGLQFHPESILTPLGPELLARFLTVARARRWRSEPVEAVTI